MRNLYFVLFIITVLLMVGCSNLETPTGQVVNEPVKKTEANTTLSERIQEPREEKTACNDECSTNSCNGYKFISCETIGNGCKLGVDKGLVVGKCGVECIQDSDCINNQICESNKCKTKDKSDELMKEAKKQAEELMEKAMQETEKQVEEIMNRCNAPLKCSSNCVRYSDVGQKNCLSGQVCCVTEQSEITEQDNKTQNDETSKSEALNKCYKRAKECSDDILGIELELKSACMEIYMWTSGTSELLDFAEGLC